LPGQPYLYRCPHGVPCACIPLPHTAAPSQAHIWLRACSAPAGHLQPCSDSLACGDTALCEHHANGDFYLAVDLLTIMADSAQCAGVLLPSSVRQASKRLTAHQRLLVRHVCRAVHARCEDVSLRLGAFAAENAVSVAYLCTLFTQAVGVPFRSYLQAWRMAKVRRWLSESRLSIKEIAVRVGYNDPNRLRLAFKAATGLPPREWRERRLAEREVGRVPQTEPDS
jgi:AraC-like DNA-binding protein